MKNKIYAGIGSRQTPEHILLLMEQVAEHLAKEGYTLRSGGADGADLAFEKGCDKANGNKEIFLPWKGFNGSKSNLIVQKDKAFEIAEKFHPNWINLSGGVKKLMARNTHQVLGWNIGKDPIVDFIICYTKNKGGTTQALRIAKYYNIPILNLWKT